MNSYLADLILAKGLGEGSVSPVEISGMARTTTRQLVKPQEPWEYAIVHRMSLSLPSPNEMGAMVSKVGSATITSTGPGYTPVKIWSVPADRYGSIREISLDTDNWAKTNWELYLNNAVEWTGQQFQRPLTIPFPPDNALPGSSYIAVQALSTDGTAITAYASISGKEWAPYLFSVRLRKAGGVATHTVFSSTDIIEQGVPLWAYISRTDPLIADIQNVNGADVGSGANPLLGEYFLAHFWLINTDTVGMKAISRLAQELGVKTDILPATQPISSLPAWPPLASVRR